MAEIICRKYNYIGITMKHCTSLALFLFYFFIYLFIINIFLHVIIITVKIIIITKQRELVAIVLQSYW